MRLRPCVRLLVFAVAVVSLSVGTLRAQINTVDLSGQVLDPRNLAVPGAKVTVENLATGAKRGATSDSNGQYTFVGLPPGRYKLTVEAKGFAKLVNPELVLTIGERAEFNPVLQVASAEETVTVTGSAELIETTRTAVANTVDTEQINNLPINGRNYINFTLLDSQAKRDDAPSIGAAPTSGINFSGQRARSNEVSVDGADAVDNSVNGIRSTVSQEAVQEFQIIDNSYMPEFGRAMGGVVNIVTKSGSNQTHGNIFGYLRNKAIQARNPFSVEVDPATGNVVGVKQGFTRVQAGATLGGPIQKDRTFYFFSFETTRREETGFTNIGSNNFGFDSAVSYPFFPAPLTLTHDQNVFVTTLLQSGVPQLQTLAAQYAIFAGSASSFGLNGLDFGAIDQAFGVPPCSTPTPQGLFPCFPLPVPGPTGAFSPARPASFVPLTSLIGNYPIKEKTQLWSARLDHIWNPRNSTSLRVTVTPSFLTGIQVNAQNQNFGQNAASRTSIQRFLDQAIVAQHVSSLTDHLFNEFRFQAARRGLHYGFSQLPGGSNVGVNIPGVAFFGREPFSTLDRIERRFQWTDALTWVRGRHTFKMGADTNLIQIRSRKPVVFALDFGGLFNFGGLSASTASGGLFPSSVPTPGGVVNVPGFSPVQTYGLGLPQVFIQGVGTSNQLFDNKTLGAFFQDTWRLNSRLTLNYGVRYDIEWTPTFKAATPINQAAEQAMGVIEGIPVDNNNVSPRFGLAWDPTGSGKTVIRADYGIFFDHPLLAIAFDSTTADGTRNSQLETILGAPSAMSIANPANIGAFNAASIFQGVLNTAGIPGISYLPNEQRFDPFNSPLFNNQNYLTAGFPLGLLPFTFPVARNFEYGYAQQASLSVEREVSKDFKIGLSYNYTHALRLNRPRNFNVPSPAMLVLNFQNALASGQPQILSQSIILVNPTSPSSTTCGTAGLPGEPTPLAIGVLFGCPAPLAGLDGQIVASTPLWNFFRPSGPNPSFGFTALEGLLNTPGVPSCFAPGLCIPKGPGVPVPWSSIDMQESSGKSIYHGFTLTVSKRFSHHVEFLSSWTWSHAIDDSTDLQSLLEPQDDRFTNRERSSSSFDQRHRWVTSAIFESPYKSSDQGWMRKFLANFTVAPILEVASGRPYTVLTGTDYNGDFASNTDRPSVVPIGTPGSVQSPFIKNVAFSTATVCDVNVPGISPPFGCTGNLGRNAFVRPGYFNIDLRVSRKFYFAERANLEVIAEGFNMLNRFNVADVNPLCDPAGGVGSCQPGQPTAALDPRQFQFALKLNF